MRSVALAAIFLCALTGFALGQGQPLTVLVVPSCGTGTSGYTPTQNRLATMDTTGKLCVSGSGGGGGAAVPTKLITGVIFDVSDPSFVAYLWASNVANPKNESIYTCDANTKDSQVIVKDEIGTAATYNITLSPVSGTIDGVATYTMNFNFQSVTMVCDGAGNWGII